MPDIDFLCLFCPLSAKECDAESPRCPYQRWDSLRKKEDRARRAGQEWLSERQIRTMLAEIGQQM